MFTANERNKAKDTYQTHVLNDAEKRWRNPIPKGSPAGNRIVIITFLIIITFMGAMKLVWPEQSVSQAESRTLASRPKLSVKGLVDGSYPVEFESYYVDQFPLRNGLIGISDRMRSMIRLKIGDDIQIVKGNTDMGQGDSNELLDDTSLPGDEVNSDYRSPYVD